LFAKQNVTDLQFASQHYGLFHIWAPTGALQRAAAGEASDQNHPYDYDSEDTSDGGDEIAGAPRTLQQKKKLRIKRRDRYMIVRRASPLGDLDPRGGTRRLIAQLRTTPGM